MKFFETHFDEYVQSVHRCSLHPHLSKLYEQFPKRLSDLQNLIFYGPKGVGKYSQVLACISRYSHTDLKYEKRMSVAHTDKDKDKDKEKEKDKGQIFIKLSDIHFEVDLALLGCHSMPYWVELYNKIVDSVSARPDPCAIIVCKNFNKIHSELLDSFYSYMQDNENVKLKYILITEHLSFIPNNILNHCKIIRVKRPTVAMYNKCLAASQPQTQTHTTMTTFPIPTTSQLTPANPMSYLFKTQPITLHSFSQIQPGIETKITKITSTKTPLHKITNIKSLRAGVCDALMNPHEMLCNKIIEILLDPGTHLTFLPFRDLLYELLIYDLDIHECIWYILEHLIMNNHLPVQAMTEILMKTYTFLQYYNNNYRPIYHLENYMFILINHIHGYKTST